MASVGTCVAPAATGNERNVAWYKWTTTTCPLSSLRRKKMKTRAQNKSASPRRTRTPSPPRRTSKKNEKRAVLKAYSLDAGLLGPVQDIHGFVSEHRKDVPVRIGFVVLGQKYPVLVKKQSQLDALPPGEYDAQIIYAHPTKAQLASLERRRHTSVVSKASRLKS